MQSKTKVLIFYVTHANIQSAIEQLLGRCGKINKIEDRQQLIFLQSDNNDHQSLADFIFD